MVVLNARTVTAALVFPLCVSLSCPSYAPAQIGPHGAGLFHVIFTPDRTALIELQIDHTTERKHFNNLARWSGHAYSSRGGPNPVNTEDATSMVREAVLAMDLSKH